MKSYSQRLLKLFFWLFRAFEGLVGSFLSRKREDINSRTVLKGAEVKDALMELLNDESFQSAIQKEVVLIV